ncbi:HdeD family acid-resistance protein [Thermococcus sp.]
MEYGEVGKNWVWLLGLGIIFITLGFAGLLLLPLVTITSVAIFGAFMLVAGALQIAQGIAKARDWKSRGLHILMGIIYVIGGIATLENPVLATTILTLVLGFSLIAIGSIRIAVAFQNKDVNQWALMTLSGVLTIFLGFLIVIQWPWSSLWAIGLFVSLDLIMSGANFMAIALTAKGSKDETPILG